MDETAAIVRARRLVSDTGIASIPVDVGALAASANAKVTSSRDMEVEESGRTFPLRGKHIITVNANHKDERQRFTALHEIAHIVLDLPSQHHGNNVTTSDLVSYRRRPHEEVLCDVFAAECLLPHKIFSKDVQDVDVSMEAVSELAGRYKASLTSTGSRFAVNARVPCAFVLIEHGKVRYVSSSQYLRELSGWIDIGVPAPRESVAYRLINGGTLTQDYDEILTDTWFNRGVVGFDLLAEEAKLLPEWNQCLSLIWFEGGFGRVASSDASRGGDDTMLEELDGNLPWPSKKIRK